MSFSLRWLLGLGKLCGLQKNRNFASCFCFASCIMRKHYFCQGGKTRRSFPYFHYKFIFCCAELFDAHSILNLNLFLNINTNQTSRKQVLNFIKSSHIFSEQPQRSVLEVNCQDCNFTLLAFLRILVIFFQPVLKNLSKF